MQPSALMNSSRNPLTAQFNHTNEPQTLLYLSPNPHLTWPGMFKNFVFGPHESVDINTNTQFLNLYEAFKQLIKAPEDSFIWKDGKIALFQYQFRQLWAAQPWDNLQSFILHDEALHKGIVSFTRTNYHISEIKGAENVIYQGASLNIPQKAKRLRPEAAPFISQGAALQQIEASPAGNFKCRVTSINSGPHQRVLSMDTEIRKEEYLVSTECPCFYPKPCRPASFGFRRPRNFFWEMDDSGVFKLIFKPLHPVGYERAIKLGESR